MYGRVRHIADVTVGWALGNAAYSAYNLKRLRDIGAVAPNTRPRKRRRITHSQAAPSEFAALTFRAPKRKRHATNPDWSRRPLKRRRWTRSKPRGDLLVKRKRKWSYYSRTTRGSRTYRK